MSAFQLAKVWNLEITTLDHYPIFLDPKPISGKNIIKRFRFENSWIQEVESKRLSVAGWFVIVGGEQQIYLFKAELNLVERICYAGALVLQATSSSELSGVIGN